MFRPLRSFILVCTSLSLISVLNACGTPDAEHSKLGIVGGRPVAAGEKGPAVGLLLRYPDSMGGVYLTKTCTGVRVSSEQILTAASCLSGAGNNSVQLTFLFSGDGSRAKSPTISRVDIHPDYDAADGETSPYNVALIRLASFPAELDSKVLVAGLSDRTPAVGDSLKVYGAGCEKLQANEKCDGPYSILRHLKTFDTNLEKFETDNFAQKFFKVLQANGQSVDGDQGGPVLDSQGSLVGLASYRKSDDTSDPDGKYSVYLNLTESEIKGYLASTISNQLPSQKALFEINLVEGENGSFMPVGSYPTVEISSSLQSFDVSFTLNGMPIDESKLVRNGLRYTLQQGLLEGRNVIAFAALDADSNLVLEEEIPVFAGSRTISIAVPELMNTAELDMRADLILNKDNPARGRGWFEGNNLVFKNVPSMPTIARIDFPGAFLSYTEFFTESTNSATLQGGRMAAVSANENLDWSKGLAGWTVVSGAKAFRVVKGKDLKEGGAGSIGVASTRGRINGINEVAATLNPVRYLDDTPFVLQNEKNYVVISPDVGQTAELVKTFQPSKGRKSLELSFALRIRGFNAGSPYNPRALGEYVVQIRNSKGEVTEYLGNMESSSLTPAANGLFFDQVEHIVADSADPVEVTIKMTAFEQIYGIPELIVGEVREDDIGVSTFKLDDGVNKTIYEQTVEDKDKKLVTLQHDLKPAPLESISLGSCLENCVFDPKLKSFHALWGQLGISSAKGINIEDIRLVVYDGTKELGAGELYDDVVKNALIKAIGPNESTAVTSRSPLFRYPQTIVPRSDAKGYQVQLLLRIKTSTGVKTKAFGTRLTPLTWYAGKNGGTTSDVDRSFGGDKWARAWDFKNIAKLSTLTVTDAANVHGGYFYPHKSHKDGRSVDLSHGNNTDKTVDDVVKLLEDPEFLETVKLVYVYAKPIPVTDADRKNPKKKALVRRADAVATVIKRLQELTDVKASDGRYISPFIKLNGQYVIDKDRSKVSILRHYDGHHNHIHIQFN